MNKQTKLTLDELVRRKVQIQEAKKQRKTQELYIDSLGGTITISEPSKEILADVSNMDKNAYAINKYVAYNCVTEPNLKSHELQEAYECAEPYDIVDKLFSYGEVMQIGSYLNQLAGLSSGVSAVEEIKNS